MPVTANINNWAAARSGTTRRHFYKCLLSYAWVCCRYHCIWLVGYTDFCEERQRVRTRTRKSHRITKTKQTKAWCGCFVAIYITALRCFAFAFRDTACQSCGMTVFVTTSDSFQIRRPIAVLTAGLSLLSLLLLSAILVTFRSSLTGLVWPRPVKIDAQQINFRLIHYAESVNHDRTKWRPAAISLTKHNLENCLHGLLRRATLISPSPSTLAVRITCMLRPVPVFFLFYHFIRYILVQHCCCWMI